MRACWLLVQMFVRQYNGLKHLCFKDQKNSQKLIFKSLKSITNQEMINKRQISMHPLK